MHLVFDLRARDLSRCDVSFASSAFPARHTDARPPRRPLTRPGEGATCWARPSEEGVQRQLRAESEVITRVGLRTSLRGVLDRRED